MRVVPNSTLVPVDGQLIDAGEINRLRLALSDAIEDCGQRRYSHAVLPAQFVAPGGTLTEASSFELRTFRFSPPVDCVVTSAQLYAHLTTTSGITVSVVQKDTGTTPVGAVSPLFSLGTSTDATVRQEDFSVQRWSMIAGKEYVFTVSGTSFTAVKLDLNINIAVDRWQGVVPSYSAQLVTDASTANGTSFASERQAAVDAAALFAGAPGKQVFVLSRQNFTSSTSSNILRIEVPRGEGTRMVGRVVRMQVFASVPDLLGTTVIAELRPSSGPLLASATATLGGAATAWGDSGALSFLPLTGTGVSSTSADYNLRLVAGNTSVVEKAVAFVWVDWT